MGQIVVNVGSFDLTSHNGNTAYSSVRYFDIPANAGITGCTATFAQHVNTGSFQGKSFSLNGAQAHPNTPWPTSGIALNPALLSTGQNTFRAAVKSQAGLSARWSIGVIYLTIDYNDVGGGGGTTDPGSISINKSSLTAGESLTVSITGASSGVYRDVYIQKMPSTANIRSVVQGHGSGTGSWTVVIPESWCETLSPNDPSFEVRIYMASYIAGGTDVGNGAKMLTVNVPSSAKPTIGTFTATLNKNGVDASITGYVQNYSKVGLAIGGEAGALGSSIASYSITGGGFSAAASSATMGPFGQTGDITFTSKVTDSRGRTATRTVTINVLAYTPVSGVNLTAYRSDASKAADDEGAYASIQGRRVFSSLDGQNSGTIKGRVYEKDTTPGGWTAMSDDTLLLLGGSMSIEKGYTAEIAINDKITAVVYVFQIPTAIVGIHITPGATGGGFGMYGQPNRWDFNKPIYNPNGRCFDERFDGLTSQYINVGSGGGRSLLINTGIVPTNNVQGYLEIRGVSTAPSIAAFFTVIKFNYTHSTTRFYSAIQNDLGGALDAGSVGIYLGTIQILIPNVTYYPTFNVGAWIDGNRTPVTLSDVGAGTFPGTPSIALTKV